jgi:glycosyltransferase involved in cell wall biosynthesis
MKVLFLARATLYSVYGGDTVQILSTAKYLRILGLTVDIKRCNESIDYATYDLIHVFNIIRPADTLYHVKKSKKPYVISTIFVDYSEYHKYNDRGIFRLLNRVFSGDRMEYIKTIARWIKNGESITSLEYLFMGHYKSVRKLALGASMLLPNSESEYRRFSKAYHVIKPYRVIYNGIDPEIFKLENSAIHKERDPLNVLCVARIEGKKNQLNLIKALNNTPFKLTIIGKPAPNHMKYNEDCRQAAASNIIFEDFVPQEQLMDWYLRARVHVLPSWNETTGLSSLEAAYAGCNIVITPKGDTSEYFGSEAFYCEPDDIRSIYNAIEKASQAPFSDVLRNRIISVYNWKVAAEKTLAAYNESLKPG